MSEDIHNTVSVDRLNPVKESLSSNDSVLPATVSPSSDVMDDRINEEDPEDSSVRYII